MSTRKRTRAQGARIAIEMAGHAAMGVAMGLGLSFAMILTDAFGINTLIAHGADARAVMTIFIGTITLSLAIGTTLTGFVFTMMDGDR